MGKNKSEKGTYVSRSVYQKVVEENRHLKEDIWQMIMRPITAESILVRIKWKDKFQKDKELQQLLHDYAVKYVKDNPDSVVAQISRTHPPKEKVTYCQGCGAKIAPGNVFCGECMCEDDCDPFS